MTAQTQFDVASAALIIVGGNPVTSFSGTSTEQVACNHLYTPTVENLLEMHPWRFASKTEQLSRKATAPSTIWSAAYSAPADSRRIEKVVLNIDGAAIPFDRFEDEIHCDAGSSDKVYCTFTYKPSESQWPAYFTRLVHLDLAMQFAVTLAAKIDLQKSLADQFERQFRYAKSTDSQQQTTKKMRTQGRGSIIEMRKM